jgi:hypothetical protein
MMRSPGGSRLSDQSPTTSMPVLPEAIWPRSTHSHAAKILFRARVSGGEQAGEPTALAREAGKPPLLLGSAAREPCAGLARGEPGLLARISVKGATVTRDDTSPTC